MKAVRIFGICFLYNMVINVQTDEAVDKKYRRNQYQDMAQNRPDSPNEDDKKWPGQGGAQRRSQNSEESNIEDARFDFDALRQSYGSEITPSRTLLGLESSLLFPPSSTPRLKNLGRGSIHNTGFNDLTLYQSSPVMSEFGELSLSQNPLQWLHEDNNVPSLLSNLPSLQSSVPSLQSTIPYLKLNEPFLQANPPTLSSDLENMLSQDGGPYLNSKFQPTPCQNGSVLNKILSRVLILLLQSMDNSSPDLDTVNNVLNTLESQLQTDGLQNIQLYPKLLDIQKMLMADPESGIKTPDIRTKIIFKDNVPQINQPDCNAAFLKLMALAYTAYLQLSKYPNCKSDSTLLHNGLFSNNAEGPHSAPYIQQNPQAYKSMFENLLRSNSKPSLFENLIQSHSKPIVYVRSANTGRPDLLDNLIGKEDKAYSESQSHEDKRSSEDNNHLRAGEHPSRENVPLQSHPESLNHPNNLLQNANLASSFNVKPYVPNVHEINYVGPIVNNNDALRHGFHDSKENAKVFGYEDSPAFINDLDHNIEKDKNLHSRTPRTPNDDDVISLLQNYRPGKRIVLPRAESLKQRSSDKDRFDANLEHLVSTLDKVKSHPAEYSPFSELNSVQSHDKLVPQFDLKPPNSDLTEFRVHDDRNPRPPLQPELNVLTYVKPPIQQSYNQLSESRLSSSSPQNNQKSPAISVAKMQPNREEYIKRLSKKISQLPSHQPNYQKFTSFPKKQLSQSPYTSPKSPLLVSVPLNKYVGPSGLRTLRLHEPITLNNYNNPFGESSESIPQESFELPNQESPKLQFEPWNLDQRHNDLSSLVKFNNVDSQQISASEQTKDQGNVINIYISQCKDFSESQKLYLKQLLQPFRNLQTEGDVSKQNEKLLNLLLIYMKAVLDKIESSISADDKSGDFNSGVNIPFLSYIYRLIQTSLPNQKDSQIAFQLLEDNINKLASQGIDLSKRENLKLILVFVKNIIAQLLEQASSPILTEKTEVPAHLPALDPVFEQYLFDIINKQIESDPERQLIFSRFQDFINDLNQQGYDFSTKKAKIRIHLYLEQLILQLKSSTNKPDEKHTVIDPDFLASIYNLIISSVPASSVQTVLMEVKAYIDRLVEEGIDLNKPENRRRIITHIKEIISRKTIETTPTAPVPPVNPEFLEKLYVLIISSVQNVEQREMILENTKKYIKTLIQQSVDLNEPGNLTSILSYVKDIISRLASTAPAPPLIDPEFLEKIYNFIVNSVQDVEQRENVIQKLQMYIKKLVEQGVDFSTKEDLYLLVAYIKQLISKIDNVPVLIPTQPEPTPTEEIPHIDRQVLIYAYELIHKLILDPVQRETAIRYLHENINWAVKNNYNLDNRENLNELIIRVISLVKDKEPFVVPISPAEPGNKKMLTPKTVEITYSLSTKMQFGRSGVVKYRVPYDTFVTNIRDILLRKPMLRSEKRKLEEALSFASNITEVSPELKELPKDQLIKLISYSGSFIEAKIPDDDINNSKAELKVVEKFEKMVHELDNIINYNNIDTHENNNIAVNVNDFTRNGVDSLDPIKNDLFKNVYIVHHDSSSSFDPTSYLKSPFARNLDESNTDSTNDKVTVATEDVKREISSSSTDYSVPEVSSLGNIENITNSNVEIIK